MQGTLDHKSEVKAWSDGKEVEFFDWIPPEGPTGGRMVVHGFRLIADWQIDVATALAQGEDFPRLFTRVMVVQRDGVVRWNLTGDESRIACYGLLGPRRVSENADTGASETNLTGTTELYIPMSKPLVHTGEDFALGVESFGKVVIQGCGAAALDIGSSDVTIDSINYYVIADCSEEHDLQFKCVDTVKADELTSTGEGVISVGGKIHDLYLHKRGASGATALTNLTDIRIDEPRGMLPLSKKTELVRKYRWKRGCASNLNSTMGGEVRADPFVTGGACPVFISDERTSAWSGPYADRVKLTLTNTEASLKAITRTVKPRSPESANQLAARYGVRAQEQIVVKTAKKTKRALGDWPREMRPYLALKTTLR